MSINDKLKDNKMVIEKLTLNLLEVSKIKESNPNPNNQNKSKFINTEIIKKNECVSDYSMFRKPKNLNTYTNKSEIINQIVKIGSGGNKSNSHRSIINIREINKINR